MATTRPVWLALKLLVCAFDIREKSPATARFRGPIREMYTTLPFAVGEAGPAFACNPVASALRFSNMRDSATRDDSRMLTRKSGLLVRPHHQRKLLAIYSDFAAAVARSLT